MQFRFECTKPGNIEDNVFPEVEYPTNLKVVHEFEMDDSTRWDNIMLQFAKFLDATGYVDVYEKVSVRVEEEWPSITEGFAYENTGHTGLSD